MHPDETAVEEVSKQEQEKSDKAYRTFIADDTAALIEDIEAIRKTYGYSFHKVVSLMVLMHSLNGQNKIDWPEIIE